MSKKSVVIYVAGQRFSLCTEDTEEYVIQVGEKVDTLIRGVQKDNPRLNRDGCATLVALSLCDDETKLSKKVEALRLQIKDYLEENERLRGEVEELKAKLESSAKTAEQKKEDTPSAPSPVSEKAEAPAEEKPAPLEKTETPHRQTAFVGKNFPSKDHGKKNKHHHNNNQNKNTQPAPFYKKQADTEEVPEPMQFSIFDTDFI